ncbi:hypothetical protein CTAYLR_010120 [Chrysophaeum taylorii]|uniref:Enoyl-CoA hydratase/isomerase domain-containing protein n=1 Tax=Chrysophaeum taylorii TaxID=2483200 RepID=A0AAD7UHC7_9STRA|nr:hypothetical protein CTAYLR_010120 [Chrysophaeum taylorii]
MRRVSTVARKPRRMSMVEYERRLAKVGASTERTPPFVEVTQKPGLRRLSIVDFDAYAHSSRNISRLLGRWDAHNQVSLVVIDGSLGSFAAKDTKELEAAYALYARVRAMKTPCVTMVDGLATAGGLGLVGKRSVASTDAWIPPFLDEDTFSEVPRLVDGGVGYRLSRASPKHARAALLGGRAVHGGALKLSGLVDHVVSAHAFKSLYYELDALAEDADPERLGDNIDSLLAIRSHVSSAWVEDEDDFDAFATLCFEPNDLPTIIKLLEASSDHPRANDALAAIRRYPGHAQLLATFVDRCALLSSSYEDCLKLEKILATNILLSSSSGDDHLHLHDDLESYFVV